MRIGSNDRSYAEETRFLPLLFFGCLTATRLFSEEEVKQIVQTGQMLNKQGQVNYRRTEQPEVPAAEPQPLDLATAFALFR